MEAKSKITTSNLQQKEIWRELCLKRATVSLSHSNKDDMKDAYWLIKSRSTVLKSKSS
jgi:hypothetical protein